MTINMNELIDDIMQCETKSSSLSDEDKNLIKQLEKCPSALNKYNRKDWKKKRKSTENFDYIIMMKEK